MSELHVLMMSYVQIGVVILLGAMLVAFVLSSGMEGVI